MTKKDYILIAKALQPLKDESIEREIDIDEVIDKLCKVMLSDNPRFNEDKFREFIFN